MAISLYHTDLINFPNELIAQPITYLPTQDANNFGKTCWKAYCLVKANTMFILCTNARKEITEITALKDRVKVLRGNLLECGAPYQRDNQGLIAQVWSALQNSAIKSLGNDAAWTYLRHVIDRATLGYMNSYIRATLGYINNKNPYPIIDKQVSRVEHHFDIQTHFPELYALAHSYIDLNDELKNYCQFKDYLQYEIVDGKLFKSVISLEELQKTIAKYISLFASRIEQIEQHLGTYPDREPLLDLLEEQCIQPLRFMHQQCSDAISNTRGYMNAPWKY